MWHVASVCTPCCMLLRVVGGCCTKCETGQTPNISFVPWSPKRSETTVDPFAQLFQHCWGHAHELHMVYKVLWVVSSNDALQVPTLLGVVASVCTPLPTRTHLIFQPQSQVSHVNGIYLSQIGEMDALVFYHLQAQTCEFHSGIVFTICTSQFLLKKNGCESLKLVSLVSALN